MSARCLLLAGEQCMRLVVLVHELAIHAEVSAIATCEYCTSRCPAHSALLCHVIEPAIVPANHLADNFNDANAGIVQHQ